MFTVLQIHHILMVQLALIVIILILTNQDVLANRLENNITKTWEDFWHHKIKWKLTQMLPDTFPTQSWLTQMYLIATLHSLTMTEWHASNVKNPFMSSTSTRKNALLAITMRFSFQPLINAILVEKSLSHRTLTDF